jgi:hypothetical protein
MAFRLIAKPKASYFLPTARPRFKPRVVPRIGIGGIEKPRLAPRVVPTPLSGISSKVTGGGGGLSGVKSFAGGAKISTLTKQSSTGTKASGTMSKPPKSSRPVQVKPPKKKPITGSHPAGAIPIPRTMASQKVSSGPKIVTPKTIKRQASRKSPFKLPKI